MKQLKRTTMKSRHGRETGAKQTQRELRPQPNPGGILVFKQCATSKLGIKTRNGTVIVQRERRPQPNPGGITVFKQCASSERGIKTRNWKVIVQRGG